MMTAIRFMTWNMVSTGKVLERQRDSVTAELKYRIEGKTADDESIEVLVKEAETGTVVIVTVYRP